MTESEEFNKHIKEYFESPNSAKKNKLAGETINYLKKIRRSDYFQYEEAFYEAIIDAFNKYDSTKGSFIPFILLIVSQKKQKIYRDNETRGVKNTPKKAMKHWREIKKVIGAGKRDENCWEDVLEAGELCGLTEREIKNAFDVRGLSVKDLEMKNNDDEDVSLVDSDIDRDLQNEDEQFSNLFQENLLDIIDDTYKNQINGKEDSVESKFLSAVLTHHLYDIILFSIKEKDLKDYSFLDWDIYAQCERGKVKQKIVAGQFGMDPSYYTQLLKRFMAICKENYNK